MMIRASDDRIFPTVARAQRLGTNGSVKQGLKDAQYFKRFSTKRVRSFRLDQRPSQKLKLNELW
jgi:hypothetical protein